MKVMMLGNLKAVDDTPYLARPMTWLFLGALGVMGWVVYNELQIERGHGLRGTRKRRR